MTTEEFRAALRALNLSIRSAGPFLGVHDVTTRRWALGTRAIPPTVEKFLNYMLAAKLLPIDVDTALDNYGSQLLHKGKTKPKTQTKELA